MDLRTILPLVLALAGCTPSVLRESKRDRNPLHPRPEPCADVAHDGAAGVPGDKEPQPAMCCPEGFAAGDNRLSVCPRGSCCPLEEDMGNPPPVPVGPVGEVPWQ